MENQVKKLFTFYEEPKKSQVKVTEPLEFLSENFGNLEEEI